MTTALTRRKASVVTEEQIKTYAGIWLLKKLDLKPRDGGLELPFGLPAELTPLEELLAELKVAGLIELNHRKDRWQLTKAGIGYLAALIDEAERLIDEFDDWETPDVVAELRRRNLDPLRARFLWGWFDGEFDDLVEFQRSRGVSPVQPLWAYYLTDDEFYAEIAKDLDAEAGPPGPDDGRDDGYDDRRRRDDDDLDDD